MPNDLFIGIDAGTSGVRAVIIDQDAVIQSQSSAAMPNDRRDPVGWWQTAVNALHQALAPIDRNRVRALAVDGTSGTMLPVDAQGNPLAAARMYNDTSNDTAALQQLRTVAPAASGAHGSTSGALKALHLQATQPHRLLHQADWLQWQFSGRMVSDFNNALKTGFDPITERWPAWLAELGIDTALLPPAMAPGSPIGTITHDAARTFDLPETVQVAAGTTDGCASFLATGARAPGDGVSALGTTLTIKLLSDAPIFAPEYGIYSHKLLGMWLAGGASNSGGNVLLKFFSETDMASLTKAIDPSQPTGLDYYPLTKPGERFPIADSALPPKLEPRPEEPAIFLQGLFEGIAAIEQLGYARLSELGAPALKSIRSVGGGARNHVWQQIRQNALNVPFITPRSTEAAFGTALLAKQAMG